MDKSLIEKNKNEMLKMYRSSKAMPVMAPMPTVTENTAPVEMTTENMASTETVTETTVPDTPTVNPQTPTDSTGRLTAIVTTLRTLYPVPGARVTVFTGNYDDMTVLDTAFTDQSGRTEAFILPAPNRDLSLTSGASDKPYASYNMLIQADGYIDNIHLNIPVFSGVDSLQSSNMMLRETAGENKGPQIFDEAQQFTL